MNFKECSIGLQVQLTKRYAGALMKGRKLSIDWRERTGVIKTFNRRFAYVIWEGTQAANQVQIEVLELAKAESMASPREWTVAAKTRVTVRRHTQAIASKCPGDERDRAD